MIKSDNNNKFGKKRWSTRYHQPTKTTYDNGSEFLGHKLETSIEH